MKFGLLGHPLGHSFSQKYFELKFKEEKIDAEFLNFDISSADKIRNEIKAIENLKGFSVTIPYKKVILQMLDKIDDVANEIGAVNCVKVEKDGTWKGFNTDYIGFKKSIEPLLNSNHTQALILGNGGAAKAITYALKIMKIPFKIISRNDYADLTYQNLTREIIQTHTIIVNCTPLGMYPNDETFPDINYKAVTNNHILYDLVYNPSETVFLKKGKEQGATIINGQKMLEIQAEAAWNIWNEVD